MIKTCLNCGKTFKTYQGKVKTCSRECGCALNRRRKLDRARTLIPHGVIDRRTKDRKCEIPAFKNCVICGQTFAVSKSQINNYSTCSSACSSIHKESINRKYPDGKKTCPVCKSDFVIRLNDHNTKHRVYCSDECRLIGLNSTPRPKKKMFLHLSRGYIRATINEESGIQRHVMMHRYVMEQKLGRPLTSKERVHHINGNKIDNRPENLMLFSSQSEHIKYEHLTHQRIVNHKTRKRDEKGRFS